MQLDLWMTQVTRQAFKDLSLNGGYLNLDKLPPKLQTAFKTNGITDADLQKIAGQDRVIRGQSEFQQLFQRIDQLDTDGNKRTLRTHRNGQTTKSGLVFEATRDAIVANQKKAAAEGGRRFAGIRELDRVAKGSTQLSIGSKGASVRAVQQALIDIGALRPDHGVTGVYDKATANAVRRLQRDAGVGIDGTVGAETLSALISTAPPPGQRLERKAQYDRLYADGRLDVTIAIGFDKKDAHKSTVRGVMSELRAQKYTQLDYNNLTAQERKDYGLTTARYDPNARYFAKTFKDPKTGKNVTNVVRLITPGTDGAKARASFEKAMQQDEVVMYNGHARYGTGPDFDGINSGKGNFVVDPHGNRRHQRPPAGLRRSIRGRQSDLRSLSGRPSYQVLVMNGCNTEEYLHNMRSQKFNRSTGNTDIIATQAGPRFMWSGKPAMRFLQGLKSRESNDSMFKDQARMEQAHLRKFSLPKSEIKAAGSTFVDNGFLDNAKRVAKPKTP